MQDVTWNGGVANGSVVDEQRIDLSKEKQNHCYDVVKLKLNVSTQVRQLQFVILSICKV